MNKTYDILIIGSGLSAVTCLKYINQKNRNLKVGIITGFRKRRVKISSKESNYIKNKHNKISQKIKDFEIDKDVLKSSIKHKSSIFSSKNHGGLASFWGGGYFPEEVNQNIYISYEEFINNNFHIYKKRNCEELKINSFFAKKLKLNNDSTIELDSKFLVSSGNFLSERNIFLYNPYDDIHDLSLRNKNIEIINQETVRIEYHSESDLITINNKDMKKFQTKKLLVCAGVINSPKILYNSGLLKTKEINIKDHKLYRVPLINPLAFFSYIIKRLFLFKKENNDIENYLSSLVQAYKFSISKQKIFLGIYFFPENYFKSNIIMNWLTNNKMIIFSQLYHFDQNNIYTLKLNISNKKINHKIISNSKISILNKIRILKIFFKLLLIPLPYKYGQDFGSSYHLYGSLKDLNIKDFIKPRKLNSIIKVADSSTINSIGCEPSSYKVIVNALSKVKALID